MNPTDDARIFETSWFVDPKHPLMENKIYYAKLDNLLHYVTAHRGPSTDDVSATATPQTITLEDSKGFEDTSREAFHLLQKFLDRPVG